MSGVYERNRSTSPLEWVAKARVIRREVNAIVRSEKIIHKSMRFTYGVGLFEMARDLSRHTRAAYDRYPSTPRGVLERKHYLQLAIDDCYYIVDELQSIRDDGYDINLNRLASIAELLDEEIAMLKNVKNNTKLTGKLTLDARIERAEQELADLREIAEASAAETSGGGSAE